LATRFQSYGSEAQKMALKPLTLLTHRQDVVTAFADVLSSVDQSLQVLFGEFAKLIGDGPGRSQHH
jgi:hypothetical protein